MNIEIGARGQGAGQNTISDEEALTSAIIAKAAVDEPMRGATALTVTTNTLITIGVITHDLEAYIAKLKNDSEKTKLSVLLTSLGSIGDSLTEAEKKSLEEGLKYEDELSDLQSQLEDLTKELNQLNADAVILQSKIDSLEKLIEQARKDGREHNELVQKQKELRAELDAKEMKIEETNGKIDTAKNDIASVKGKISAVVSSIGENTLKTIAGELSKILGPEKAETNAESEKKDAKEAENDLFAPIRDSLVNIQRDLAETIESNREIQV